MQEGQLTEVRRSAASLVWPLCAVGRCVDPTLRHNHVSIVPPEAWMTVDGVRYQCEHGVLLNDAACHHRVSDGFSDGCRHGWVQALGLFADPVQVWHVLEEIPGDGRRGAWDSSMNLVT